MTTVRRICRPSCELRVACPRAATERWAIPAKKPRLAILLAVTRPLTRQFLRHNLWGPLIVSNTWGCAFGLNLALGRREASRRWSILCAKLIVTPSQRVGAGPPGLVASKLLARLSGVRRVARQLWPRRLPIPGPEILFSRRRATPRKCRKPFATDRFRTRIRRCVRT